MQIQLRPYYAFCAEFESVLRRLFDARDGLSESMMLISIAASTQRSPEDVLRDMEERYRLVERHAADSSRFQLTSANRIHLAHVLDMDSLQAAGVTVEIVRGVSRNARLLGDLIPDRIDEAIEKIGEITHALGELRGATRRLHGAIHKEAHRLRTDEVPTQRRFRTIGELWDGHIMPLYLHVQPEGEIERTLGELIADMTLHVDALPEGSELHDACHTLRAEAGRARREALERFTSVHAEVLPLHQARSRHLLIEQGVEILLERVRRHGSKGADLDTLLPLTAFRFGILFEDVEIVERLSAVIEHRPKPTRAILPPGPPPTPPFDRIAALDVMRASLPLDDLLQTAIEQTRDRPISDTLALYAGILRDPEVVRTYGERRTYQHPGGDLNAAIVSVSRKQMKKAA